MPASPPPARPSAPAEVAGRPPGGRAAQSAASWSGPPGGQQPRTGRGSPRRRIGPVTAAVLLATTLAAGAVPAAALPGLPAGRGRVPSPGGAAGATVESTTAGSPRPLVPADPADPQWTTYHHDAGHTGTVQAPPLLPARPAWVSPTLDGVVYGEPLFADGLFFAATTNDTVYALDPTTGAVRWTTHLGTPVARSKLPCGDVDPLGILSTPVIDAGAHRLFVVAEEAAGPVGVQHELVGLDTARGTVVDRQVVDPPGSDPVAQQQRGSLALDGSRVVVPFGGLEGDCSDYHGWVVSAAETGGPLAVFRTPGSEVGIWSAGGPVIDPAGNVYAATGNGSSTGTYDEGNSVLKLSASMALVDSFAVSSWAADNAADADLGSAGPVLLDGGLLFEAGKRPTGFLLDTNHLGGIGGQRFAGPTGCGSFGAEAWAAPVLYVSCDGGGLRAFQVDTATARFTQTWESAAPGDGPPVVGGGAVWTQDWRGGTLYAVDPASGRTLASFPAPTSAHFVTPTIAAGEVVVAAGQELRAFAGPAGGGVPFWAATGDGGVDTYGGAPFLGSAGGLHLARPVVGLAGTPDHAGYWLVASDGGIFSFGDATFHGSTGALHLNRPIVGMAAGPGGYWLAAADGGVFSFDVPSYGSAAGVDLGGPTVGIGATADGHAYVVLAATGRAQLLLAGSAGTIPIYPAPAAPAVGLAVAG